ncbi:hypothetical protein [Limosilactobacillus reuteri]|nr:hypothetical protein [Limosilactobacillus reuteri]
MTVYYKPGASPGSRTLSGYYHGAESLLLSLTVVNQKKKRAAG